MVVSASKTHGAYIVSPDICPSEYHPNVRVVARGRMAAGVITGSGAGAGPAPTLATPHDAIITAALARTPILRYFDRSRVFVGEVSDLPARWLRISGLRQLNRPNAHQPHAWNSPSWSRAVLEEPEHAAS